MNYRNLIIKFLAGEINDEEIQILKAWLKKDPLNREIFDRENKLWHESARSRTEDIDTEKAWKDLTEHLGLGQDNHKTVLVLNRRSFTSLVAAASIAFILAIGGFSLWLKEWRSARQIFITSTVIQTPEGEKANIFLADSTQVFLNSATSLEFGTGYNMKDRIVELKGEAFFDVRTNPEKPFTVKLEKLSVSATGTRFNVLSYGNEDRIELTLEDGKMQIQISGQEGIDLKSGQQVVYFNKTGKAVVRDVAPEIYTSWKENKLRLIDTPLEEALRKIARRYNVTFEIRNRDLLDLKYTATFIDESIDDVMQMLQAVSPINYQIHNRTTISDKQYLKPRIIVEKRNASFI